jgi:hypothetical protein
MDVISEHFDAAPICVVCGCSSTEPCEGGCIWIDPAQTGMEDICSKCWAHPEIRAMYEVSEEEAPYRRLEDLDEEDVKGILS